MPRADTRDLISWWLFALLAALCFAIPCLHPFATGAMAPRELEFNLTPGPAGSGDQASLTWTRDADNARRGYWIDLAPLRGHPAPAALSYRLPSYAFHDVTLSLDDGRVDSLRLDRVREQTRFLGTRLAPSQITPHVLNGALRLDVPARRFWTTWPARLVLALAVGAAAFGVAFGMWRVTELWDRARGSCVRRVRPARWRLGVPALLVVAAPLWMLAWAPMLMEGDGGGFVWFALHFWRDGRFSNFDGWRLPGYATLISPFVGLMNHYAAGIGVLQAGLGILTSLCVWDLLRRRIGTLWAMAAAALVACDPMLLMWQRYVLSECLAGFLVTGLVWLVGRVVLDRPRPPGMIAEQVGIPLLLGGVCAAAIYTRANFQTFVVVVPAALCLAGLLRGRGWLAFTPGLLVIAVASLLVAPAFLRNREVLNRTELIVGADHNRCVFSWQNGAIEYNQVGGVTFPEYREIRAKVDSHQMHELMFTDFLAQSPTISLPEGTPPPTAKDIRSGVVTRESLARLPEVFVRRIAAGFFSLLGFKFRTPWYYSHTVDNMSRVLRGDFDTRTTTNFDDGINAALLPPEMQSAIARMREPVAAFRFSPNAAAFNALFRLYRVLRPPIIVAFLLACVAHLRRGDATMLLAAGLLLANAAGIALLQYTGMDRYGAPFYPLMATVAFAWLFSPPHPKADST